MKRVLPCDRIGVTVIGLEVPHAHIHLMPINSIADMDFSKPKKKFDSVELREDCKKYFRSLNLILFYLDCP